MRFPGPVPEMLERSTPRSFANFFTAGVAFAFELSNEATRDGVTAAEPPAVCLARSDASTRPSGPVPWTWPMSMP